jgi:hypothetical protein
MTWLLGLLPDLLHWLPVITGGGVLAGLLGLAPNLRAYALVGLAVVLAISIGTDLYYRGEWESEKAARAAEGARLAGMPD